MRVQRLHEERGSQALREQWPHEGLKRERHQQVLSLAVHEEARHVKQVHAGRRIHRRPVTLDIEPPNPYPYCLPMFFQHGYEEILLPLRNP
eukprot:CAMPEP_0118856418 /NCGR_PEP_ID=MMETSP1163-20130328/3899_1 /TAXON_ID=124430 /ORGANISM="Phaeomonas parva, Strain CCMP2877" /LENGTH=90 /DNA_ID=CAMNT_0006789519 /DNA_START=289 /DNA_END=560 /DNA_ORIENTATION=+